MAESRAIDHSAATEIDDIDARRQAPWLLTPYSSAVWQVSDSDRLKVTKTIDFRQLMADGRLLTDIPRLYRTVKEYAFWLRSERYSSIATAQIHATSVNCLINTAHALTMRGIFSFSQVEPFDLDELIEEMRFGTDAVLHASERVERFARTCRNEDGSVTIDQFINPRSPRLLLVSRILEACNLPSGATRLPAVSRILVSLAKSGGATVPRHARARRKPRGNVTTQTMRTWLYPLERLYAMRGKLGEETLRFRPFPEGADRVAKVKGVETSRTPAPPPLLALNLMEQAARVIDRYSRIGLLDAESWEQSTELLTACWIVIATFSARREGEIKDLEAGCLNGDPLTGWRLTVYIEKTVKEEVEIPVPALVERAIRLLERISATARAKSDDAYLFMRLDRHGTVRRFNIAPQLDRFARRVGAIEYVARNGEPATWHWSPHQFRRFFALLYFHRYEGASIEVLSRFLRHFSLEMTRRYVERDPELDAIWTDAHWTYQGDVARGIVSGERSQGGAWGERWTRTADRLRNRMRQDVLVASPDRLAATLALLMRRNGVVLTPKAWATCGSPRTGEAASTAECRKPGSSSPGDKGPDFSRAEPKVCAGCMHAAIARDNVRIIDEQIDHLNAAAQCPSRAGTIFGELERARLVDLEDVRATRYWKAQVSRAPLTVGDGA